MIVMENYEKMYFKLFNDITEVIHALERIQQEAEEMFLSQESEMKIGQTPAGCMDMDLKLVLCKREADR